MKKLPLSLYQTSDVVNIAKTLLGKLLCTHIDGHLTGGIITETESYAGITDRASHAYGGKRTPRTEIMYHAGGVAYVYLCYGLHSLLNVVTGPQETPHAVLIRALHPTHGLAHMHTRRKSKNLTQGPGALASALGITCALNGTPLSSDTLWIADIDLILDEKQIVIGPRIGVDYAGLDSKLPYRFSLQKSAYPSL